jgi:hypothetical protein
MTRPRLSAKAREELWNTEAKKAREAERGDFPICVHCGLPIMPGSLWDACHQPHKARWLGGTIAGCGHARCNRDHGHKVDTPAFAKNERIRKRFMDFKRPATPLPGGRDDKLKKCIDGRVVLR